MIKRCGFCLTEASQTKGDGGVRWFNSSLDAKVSICHRCALFLKSLNSKQKPFAEVDRVPYGVFREPNKNGILFQCSYCAKTESSLVFAAPGQDICEDCINIAASEFQNALN